MRLDAGEVGVHLPAELPVGTGQLQPGRVHVADCAMAAGPAGRVVRDSTRRMSSRMKSRRFAFAAYTSREFPSATLPNRFEEVHDGATIVDNGRSGPIAEML